MNYRHIYHAGNHADVFKHIVLSLIVDYLCQKPKAFFCLDAHAGIGLYPLHSAEADKTKEWHSGIARLYDEALVPYPFFGSDAEIHLRSWREVISHYNPRNRLECYPGSSAIIARLMRPQDRLIVNELHSQDAQALARNFGSQRNIHVAQSDALAIIKATLPPSIRRGFVLLDPAYERADETDHIMMALHQAHRRFATAIFFLWYPLKADKIATRLKEAVAKSKLAPTLNVELHIREVFAGGGLAGSGLLILNPPWVLEAQLAVLLPILVTCLGLGQWGQSTIQWLVPSE